MYQKKKIDSESSETYAEPFKDFKDFTYVFPYCNHLPNFGISTFILGMGFVAVPGFIKCTFSNLTEFPMSCLASLFEAMSGVKRLMYFHASNTCPTLAF